jgi:Fe-S oxidoreductase
MNEQQKLEIDNLLEEIQEILEPCIKCGMCKSLCPVFKTIKEESISPRGHTISLSKKKLEKLVFKCNLCKACEEKCPLNLKICEAIRKAREAINKKNRPLKSNEEMIKNIRKHRNPFGKDEPKEDKLYCC